MMKKVFALSIVLITLGFLIFFAIRSISPAQTVHGPHVIINNKVIAVEIADDYEEKWTGLSGREFLAEDSGMLFIFENKQTVGFWMKDMNFPIDIIWMEDNKVIRVDKNLPPEGESPLNSYNSILPVNYVLEVNAGLAENYGITAGVDVEYVLDYNEEP